MAIRIDEYGHIIRDNDPTPNRNINTGNAATGSSTEPDQLYVPDDASSPGYLDVVSQTPGSQVSSSSTPLLETSTPWYGSEGVFWTITMIFAFLVALVTATMIAPMIFESDSNSSDFLESIVNFLFSVAPYAVFIGSFVGSIWYNNKGAKKSGTYYHVAHEYLLSPLCAIAGAVCTGGLLFLLALAVYIIAAIIAIAIAIVIIAGLFSGG